MALLGLSTDRKFGWGDGSQQPIARSKTYLDYWSGDRAVVHKRKFLDSLLRHLPLLNKHKAVTTTNSANFVSRPYLYRPFTAANEIRLLHLQPGSENDLLHCVIEHVNLDDAPEYEALSYVWGQGEDLWPMAISEPGADTCQTSLRLNLFEALHQYRLPDRSRTLWADRLCINQNDLEERSQQVALMGKIFSQAGRVLVWLGWEADDPDQIREITKTFVHRLEKIDPQWTLDSASIVSTAVVEATRSALLDTPAATLSELFDNAAVVFKITCNAWWHRVWTYQEATLSHLVEVCWLGMPISLALLRGLCSIFLKLDYLYFSSAAIPLDFNLELVRRLTIASKHPRDDQHRFRKKSLTDVLERSWGLRATDPRDKIFALRNIVADNDIRYCIADYNASPRDVYTKATLGSIVSRGSLDVLIYVMNHPRRRADLPSWVPDFSMGGRTSVARSYFSYNVRQYFASGNSTPLTRLVQDGSLSLVAFRIGTIVSREGPSPHPWDKMPERWSRLVRNTASEGIYIPTNDDIGTCLQHFHRHVGENSMAPPAHLLVYKMLGPKAVDYWELWAARYLAFFAEANKRSWDARTEECCMFATDSHHFGICDPHAQLGDELFIAMGSDHPIVVRPLGDGQYKFVSLAYVHGLMRGEGLIQARAKRYPERDKLNYEWLVELNDLKQDELPFDTETITLV